MRPHAVVFDAYGTLFDVHSVVAAASGEIRGDIRALSTLSRASIKDPLRISAMCTVR